MKTATGQYLVDNIEFTMKLLGEELWEKWCELLDEIRENPEDFRMFLESEFDLERLEAALTLWNLFELPEDVDLEELGYGDIFEEVNEDEV